MSSVGLKKMCIKLLHIMMGMLKANMHAL